MQRADVESLRLWKNANRNAFFHAEEITPEQQAAWFAEFERRDDRQMFVLEHDGRALACVGFRRRRPGVLELFNLILGDRRHARSGLMSSFYGCLEGRLAQRGVESIELDVLASNAAARAWYRRQGFCVLREGDGFLTLQKSLRPARDRPRRVVIAGAGCAGLAAGLALQKRGFETVILERLDRVGGLAGGIEIGGNTYEYGPHIFHTTDPEILADVKALCSDVLEPFERTIKIKFGGRYFDYPLSVLDILTKLPPWTVVHACASLAWHFTLGLARRGRPFASSEEALRRYYGDVLYRIFFEDYIRKVWGIGPDGMAPSFALQRLPRFSPRRAVAKLWHRFFPEKPKEIAVEGYVENVEGEYFTTRKGFSLICEAFAAEYRRAGGTLRLGARVTRVDTIGRRCTSVAFEGEGGEESLPCDWFVSSMPIDRMPQLISPPADPDLLAASRELKFRGILFVGLLVERRGVLPASFMYFRDKTFNRITDLTRFKIEIEPPGATILVAEITCQPTDAVWTDEGIVRTVIDELAGDGLIAAEDVLEGHVFKAEHGYPIYRVGYEDRLRETLAGLARYDNISTIGRQGRFAYVNTHVAMKMGYEVARELERRTSPQNGTRP